VLCRNSDDLEVYRLQVRFNNGMEGMTRNIERVSASAPRQSSSLGNFLKHDGLVAE
jgi:hypothetical protein